MRGYHSGMDSRWAQAAVRHVEDRCTGEPLDRSLRITLNFHPDRWSGGEHILAALARGTYRSQFETGTSNGGLTAHPGGARWVWEQKLFGGVYDDAPAAHRPKYGALDHRRRPLGGAPRFGSAFLRLGEAVLDRATFCFPDSAWDPELVGTAQHFGLMPAVLAHERSVGEDPGSEGRDPLDGYVEAQVHGPVSLAQDVEALVLDPAYRGTEVERLAPLLGVPVEWHEGRVLTLDELERRPAYRGPEPLAVACVVARDGVLDAAVLGRAARTGDHDPQLLKYLWHHTAQWGSPRGA